MINTYPDTFAGISVHLSSSDPYTTAWGNMRANLYGVYWIPWSVQDGLYNANPYSTYESKFLTRQAAPTDVTIDMAVFGSGDTWDVIATVCIEPGGTGKTINVFMAQAVDHYGPVNFDRNMVQDGSDGVEITLAPDECMLVTENFALNAVSQASPENVKFFAWAQDSTFVWAPNPTPPPDGYYWAEIHQVDKVVAPFPGVFVHGFENGDTLGWSSVTQ